MWNPHLFCTCMVPGLAPRAGTYFWSTKEAGSEPADASKINPAAKNDMDAKRKEPLVPQAQKKCKPYIA